MGKSLAVVASLALLTSAACARGRCCGTLADRRPEAGPAVVVRPAPPAELIAADLGKNGEVFLDATILRVPADALERVVGTTPDPQGTRLSSEEGRAIRVRAEKEPRAWTVMAPKILSLPSQRATLFVGEELSPGGPDDWVGQRFEATATPTAVGRIRLDFAYAMRDVPPKGAPVDPAALQAGEVRGTGHLSEMRSGDAALFVVPATAQKERILILLTASFGTIAPDPLRDVRLTVSFRNAPLREVLRSVAETSKASLIVSPDVRDVPLTADFRDQDVRAILATLAEGRFAWSVTECGIVRITEATAK